MDTLLSSNPEDRNLHGDEEQTPRTTPKTGIVRLLAQKAELVKSFYDLEGSVSADEFTLEANRISDEVLKAAGGSPEKLGRILDDKNKLTQEVTFNPDPHLASGRYSTVPAREISDGITAKGTHEYRSDKL